MSCGIGGITLIICEDKVTSKVDGFPIANPAWVSELNTEIKVFRFKLDLYRDHCIKTCKIDEKDVADLMLYRAGLALVKALEQVNLVPLTAEPLSDVERFTNEEFAHEVEIVYERLKDIESELVEQARIVGMGAERELKLRAEIERLRAALEKIEEIASSAPNTDQGIVDCMETAREALKCSAN